MFKQFADYLTYSVLNLQKGEHLSESVNFFLYDIPKIFTMLISIVFVVAIIRTYFPPERIKKILGGKMELLGNVLAAGFGVFLPFCTCSAIPLFIGMLESGIPLGVAMSFIISSPTINEVAVVLLWGLFGWKVALIYVLSGMLIAIVSGFIIGRLKMEKYVEKIITEPGCEVGDSYPKISDRIRYGFEYTVDLLKSIWIYIFIGIAIGAVIHGYIPSDLLVRYAGRSNPFAVIIAVLLGIPLYANCAGAIPVAQALLGKGLPLGTSLAFLMAVTGLSLPEFLILRKVMKPKLLLSFFGIVAVGIIIIGYLFNIIF